METKFEKITALIKTFNYSKAEAAVLTYLMLYDEGSAHDIERATDLRQPEVSIAITRLTRSKRIKLIYKAHLNANRPTNIYCLTGLPDDFINHIQKWNEAKFISKTNIVNKIRDILHEEQNLS